MTKFSVLMSVYIKENPTALSLSIESILNNTKKPDEVIIIKDGPLTKELEGTIKKYKDENPGIIKTIDNKINLGLGKSLAVGVPLCSNELIARMDSDDICRNDRFEKQLKIFSNNPEIAIVGSNITEYDESMLNAISRRVVPQYNTDIKRYSKQRNPFNHMTVMFKKSEVLGAGNYKEMHYFEDYYLWLRLLERAQGYNIQEELVYVRAGDSMIKRRGGLKYVKDIMRFESTIKREGYIKGGAMVVNICQRAIAAIVPSFVRSIAYKKTMREKRI